MPAFDEALVVEVDRILRRQHDAEAVRARLLEQRQHRRLRRRVRGRREVAEDLVHVEQRAQASTCPAARASRRSARSSSSVTKNMRSASREVRDREDREARLAVRRVEQRRARRAARPRVQAAKPGDASRLLSAQRERRALLRREERLEVEHADALERRLLDLRGSARARSRSRPSRQARSSKRREQDVLAAAQRIGVDADAAPSRPETAPCDALAQRVVVRRAAPAAARANERSSESGRPARDCPACRSMRSAAPAKRAMRSRRPGPTRRARSRQRSADRRRVLVGRAARARGARRRRSTGGSPAARSSGKVSSRLPRSPFGSIAIDRDAVDRGLLEQRDREAGLAAAGHADDHGVGRQVLRVVEQRLVEAIARREVEARGRGRRRRASRSPTGSTAPPRRAPAYSRQGSRHPASESFGCDRRRARGACGSPRRAPMVGCAPPGGVVARKRALAIPLALLVLTGVRPARAALRRAPSPTRRRCSRRCRSRRSAARTIVIDLAPKGNARRLPLPARHGRRRSPSSARSRALDGRQGEPHQSGPYRRKTVLGRDVLFYVDTRRTDTGSSSGLEFGLLGGDFLSDYVRRARLREAPGALPRPEAVRGARARRWRRTKRCCR